MQIAVAIVIHAFEWWSYWPGKVYLSSGLVYQKEVLRVQLFSSVLQTGVLMLKDNNLPILLGGCKDYCVCGMC